MIPALDTSEFSVIPFNRYEILLGGKDRTIPEFLPQIQGDGFTVEKADRVVMCQIVSNFDPRPGQGMPLTEGAIFEGSFRGLSIEHPSFGAGPESLVIVAWRKGCAYRIPEEYRPQRSPQAATFAATLTNTTVTIPIPDGARYLSVFGRDTRSAAAALGAARIELAFRDPGAAVNNTGNIVKRNPASGIGVIFNGVPLRYLSSAAELRSTNFSLYSVDMRNIPVPPGVFDAVLTVTTETAATANTTVTGDIQALFH